MKSLLRERRRHSCFLSLFLCVLFSLDSGPCSCLSPIGSGELSVWPFSGRANRANVCIKALSTPAGAPTHLRIFIHALCPTKRRRTRPRKNKNKNIAAVNARRRRGRNPDINYLEARRHEMSSGRVRFERFTKFAKADIQMVLQKKKGKVKQGDERDSDMTAAVFG